MQKRLIDNIIDECTETVKEVKPTKITIAENNHKCNFCTVYINVLQLVLVELLLIICIHNGILKSIQNMLTLILTKKQ